MSSGRWAITRRRSRVFGMYADKDIAGVAAAMISRIDRWFTVASLPGPRGAGARDGARRGSSPPGVDVSAIRVLPDIASAFAAARDSAARLIESSVFGSFLTVAAVLAATRR